MERMKRIGVGLRPRIISKIDNIMKSQFDACGEHVFQTRSQFIRSAVHYMINKYK